MKFKAFLKESTITDEELKAWIKGEDHKRHFTLNLVYGTMVIIKDGKITTNSQAAKDAVYFDGVVNIDWECPFPQNAWNNSKLTSGEFANFIIKDFTQIPDLQKMTYEGCWLKSIKGIESMNSVERLLFYQSNFEKPIGLLRLLKSSRLNFFTMTDCKLNGEKFDCGTLADIIDAHLESKNVGACQQELVEEGFKDWAKL